MINNIRKQKVDLTDNNLEHQGHLAKYLAGSFSNPQITHFRRVHRKETNYLCIPKIISNNNDIILNENDGDLINNLIICISKNGIIDNLEQVKINVNYGMLDIFTFNLVDIINISKMFPNYKLLIEEDNKQTYFININILLNIPYINLHKILKINISGLYNNIQSEVFYDSFILSKLEINRFNTIDLEEYIYKYVTMDCIHNNKNDISPPIIISKLLVEGEYIHNVIYKDDDLEINLINNSSTYNKYHNLCKTDGNCYFYFNLKAYDQEEIKLTGNLFSSNGYIKIDGYKNMNSKLYIQCIDMLMIKTGNGGIKYIGNFYDI